MIWVWDWRIHNRAFTRWVSSKSKWVHSLWIVVCLRCSIFRVSSLWWRRDPPIWHWHLVLLLLLRHKHLRLMDWWLLGLLICRTKSRWFPFFIYYALATLLLQKLVQVWLLRRDDWFVIFVLRRPNCFVWGFQCSSLLVFLILKLPHKLVILMDSREVCSIARLLCLTIST